MTHESHPISLLISGLASIALGHILGQSASEIDIVQKLLSMGGNGIGVLLMGIGIRYMVAEKNAERKTREAIQAKLDEMHTKHLEQETLSTEARFQLARAIEQHNAEHKQLSLSVSAVEKLIRDKFPTL